MLRETNSCLQTASTGKHLRASCPIHVDTMAARVAKRGRATFACKIHSLRCPFPRTAKAYVFPSKQPIVTPSKWGKPCCCLKKARSCVKCLEEVINVMLCSFDTKRWLMLRNACVQEVLLETTAKERGRKAHKDWWGETGRLVHRVGRITATAAACRKRMAKGRT